LSQLSNTPWAKLDFAIVWKTTIVSTWNLCLCFLIQLPRWVVPVVYNTLICHSDFTPIMSHWLSIAYLMQNYFGASLTVSTWNSELKLLWCFSGNKSAPWLWQGFLYWPIYLLSCQTVIDTYMNHIALYVRVGPWTFFIVIYIPFMVPWNNHKELWKKRWLLDKRF